MAGPSWETLSPFLPLQHRASLSFTLSESFYFASSRLLPSPLLPSQSCLFRPPTLPLFHFLSWKAALIAFQA